MKKLLILSIIFFLCFALSNTVQAQLTSQREFVVIVLDCSGSMGYKMGNTDLVKLDVVKQSLKDVTAQLPSNSYVGLLTFSARNVSDDWVYPLQPLDINKLHNAIDQPQDGGGTPLGRYMKIGADALLKERSSRHNYYDSYRLLVVTDGAAEDEGKVENFTPDIKRKGIRLDVIGVDMDEDHILSNKAHSYRSANDPAALTKEMIKVFSELSGNAFADGEDPYELIAGLSDSMAIAMIQGITQMDNSPIGERPMVYNDETGELEQPVEDDSGFGIFLLILLIVALVAAFLFFMSQL